MNSRARDATRVSTRAGGGRLHAGRRDFLSVVAILTRARARRALLRRLLKEERRATLRARFRDGLVPVDRVALRVLRAAVEDFPALRLLHHYLAAAARARAHDARRLALDVLARRIIRARDELAIRAVTPYQLRAVNRARLAFNRHGRWRDRARLLAHAPNVSAFGVARAAEERPEPPALHRHRLAAQLASLLDRLSAVRA